MSELTFNFNDMLQEIRTFEGVAGDFLDYDARDVLAEYVRQLEFIRSKKNQAVSLWTIAAARPLRTVASVGQYEAANRKGAKTITATISSSWEIYCPNERTKRTTPQKQFCLCGMASTAVKFWESSNNGAEDLVSVWQADLGDLQSPGCHFHIQVQREEEELPYPRGFPVPRFPSLLTSPLAAAEFAISELFQTDWSQHTNKPSAQLLTWSRIQRDRIRKLLAWQQSLLSEAKGSPIPFLKDHKPAKELFV